MARRSLCAMGFTSAALPSIAVLALGLTLAACGSRGDSAGVTPPGAVGGAADFAGAPGLNNAAGSLAVGGADGAGGAGGEGGDFSGPGAPPPPVGGGGRGPGVGPG